jgi:uncharacterized 2Fe-2S/4Fe-4S cluster protein (DUF4445 family)
MKTREVKVTFQPSGRSVFVLPGTPLVEAAGRAGIILQTTCGGNGTCGKCLVRVVSGACSPPDPNSKILSAQQTRAGLRLACQTRVEGDAVIDVPEASTFESQHQILESSAGELSVLKPVVRKIHFSIEPPSSKDSISDVARLRRAIGPVAVSAYFVRLLPAFLRRNDWNGTAVLADSKLIGIESGDTSKDAYGVAFDIGTTTLVGTLFDLGTGRELGVLSRINPQVAQGDDVISRIRKIREEPNSVTQLQELILDAVNEIIERLAQRAGISVTSVYEIVVAGNSTMQQTFCGFDSSALGEVPFTQVFDRSQLLSARRLGINVNPGGQVFVFPQIGGFVGGDTVAGMLAARLDRCGHPVLLVDIGTNGEIVLAHNGRCEATSAAAGPAFEGARITQGMRAAAGAIEKVVIRDDVMLNVIGNTRPAGICGTALIDAVAELLRLGVIDETGRVLAAGEVPDGVSAAVKQRLVDIDNETQFMLAEQDETASGEPIYLWQRDVRELQLATGAIRAGISILLRRAGLKAGDLGEILLAGAFGNFIRRRNARRIGLLPQVSCRCIRFIGNAASMGAKLALLSSDERAYADELRQKAAHVDLSMDPEFQMEFSMGMLFPDGDLDACEE